MVLFMTDPPCGGEICAIPSLSAFVKFPGKQNIQAITSILGVMDLGSGRDWQRLVERVHSCHLNRVRRRTPSRPPTQAAQPLPAGPAGFAGHRSFRAQAQR